ncbi:hypothetical protein GCM10007363_10240 [Pseudomonas fluvialis]|uniref:Uncharacterized protein n=1 Tax=Pseudomonas fluvialis TaxID=1793966 RepID=A0ABQ2AK73_9PSED|nr:hypothetical protein GCM10007363_10240 [Pseudomonas fluvialis]
MRLTVLHGLQQFVVKTQALAGGELSTKTAVALAEQLLQARTRLDVDQQLQQADADFLDGQQARAACGQPVVAAR